MILIGCQSNNEAARRAESDKALLRDLAESDPFERTVARRFSLADAAEAYGIADEGQSGKVCIVFEE